MRQATVLVIDCNNCHAEFDHPIHPTDADTDTPSYTGTPPTCPDCNSTDLTYELEEITITIELSDDTDTITDAISQLDSLTNRLETLATEEWELFTTRNSKLTIHRPAQTPDHYDFS